jgi:hypothetical protein
MKNPYEVAARAKKVLALSALIPCAESQEGVERTADWCEALSEADWQALAGAAGVKLPSSETRRLVITTLRTRQPLSVRRSA